jgi:protocatechuate 3,4-dioxygenase beta subunit
MVFAGATLAGCDQGVGHSDKPVAKEPAHAPRLHGTITDETGAPVVGAQLTLTGPAPYNTVSDHRGRYRFDEIAAGEYKLTSGYNAWSETRGEQATGYAEKTLIASATDDGRADVKLELRYQVPAMPYGAPPARRRVV